MPPSKRKSNGKSNGAQATQVKAARARVEAGSMSGNAAEHPVGATNMQFDGVPSTVSMRAQAAKLDNMPPSKRKQKSTVAANASSKARKGSRLMRPTVSRTGSPSVWRQAVTPSRCRIGGSGSVRRLRRATQRRTSAWIAKPSVPAHRESALQTQLRPETRMRSGGVRRSGSESRSACLETRLTHDASVGNASPSVRYTEAVLASGIWRSRSVRPSERERGRRRRGTAGPE